MTDVERGRVSHVLRCAVERGELTAREVAEIEMRLEWFPRWKALAMVAAWLPAVLLALVRVLP